MSERLPGFERDLVAAARRRSDARRTAVAVARRRRPPLGSLLLASLLCLGVAGSAAGATLLALRETAIPAPAERDVPREQLPARGTTALTPVRAADPEPGAPPWGVRLARSRTGLVCSTVAQRAGGRFGLVGLDGRFRALPPRIVDGCGIARPNAATLVGARVFDAKRAADVRTVVNGVAGGRVRRVVLEAGGQRRRVRIARGGVFATALAGYPEDLGIRLALTFADGHVERHPFGVSGFVVPDPAGGRAWRVESVSFDSEPGEPRDPRSCTSFRPARQVRRPAISPAACGDLGAGRVRRGYFFALRRITPGTGGIPIELDGDGNWGRHPARTAVWGEAGDDVRAVEVRGPGAERRELTIAPSRSFLAVYGPGVDADALEVVVMFRDGRTETRRGPANLVEGRSQ